MSANPIVEAYSRLADKYDDSANMQSVWSRAAMRALDQIVIRGNGGTVVDIGCGTGNALMRLAATCSRPGRRFIGIEPAENMRLRARHNTGEYPNVEILDGCFEAIPLPSSSVDYLYSILAFHWTTDPRTAVTEIARVLKPTGDAELFFIGRNNGTEFIQKTTAIFLKYMGTAGLLNSVKLRKQLTRPAALELFSTQIPNRSVEVEESYDTYYDTLEGHLGWWVRIEGQLMPIPAEKRALCDKEVADALATLAVDGRIPYTIHQLHVKVGPRTGP